MGFTCSASFSPWISRDCLMPAGSRTGLISFCGILTLKPLADEIAEDLLHVDLVQRLLAAGALLVDHLLDRLPGLLRGIHEDPHLELLREVGGERDRVARARDLERSRQPIVLRDDAAGHRLGDVDVAAHGVGGEALAVPLQADVGIALALGEPHGQA